LRYGQIYEGLGHDALKKGSPVVRNEPPKGGRRDIGSREGDENTDREIHPKLKVRDKLGAQGRTTEELKMRNALIMEKR